MRVPLGRGGGSMGVDARACRHPSVTSESPASSRVRREFGGFAPLKGMEVGQEAVERPQMSKGPQTTPFPPAPRAAPSDPFHDPGGPGYGWAWCS